MEKPTLATLSAAYPYTAAVLDATATVGGVAFTPARKATALAALTVVQLAAVEKTLAALTATQRTAYATQSMTWDQDYLFCESHPALYYLELAIRRRGTRRW
jgi:hypothetical protein